MGLLKEKRALVTGGTSGLGRQIALTFADEGAHVAIVGTNLQRAREVAQRIQDEKKFPGQKVWFETLDVSKKAEVDDAIGRLLLLWGGIDILVNCAGIKRDTLFMRMSEEAWDQVLATNLKSVYNCTHACVRAMVRARWGKIINITSVIGLTGNSGQVNYAASKLGMVGLSRSLAKELAPRNVTVNCVAPGLCATSMTDSLTEEQRERILKTIPMGRLGDPREIADAVVFLASSRSDYITGQVLTVDGGLIA